ncbi:hypothetical protein CLV71_119158 [Actinophytocola oryzae]|uniref:Uncharacterized protein n=1 Tax=Actinophytocola oryzae TaxID=502181 RepID=A0A4R7V305_9PSEU|nr:hypothetical protein CLV71_119158 [Actinophytocola oryzae]
MYRVTTDVPPARTVCHGCRQTTQFRADSGEVRPMIIPGSGMVIREKSPGVLVEESCPVCGESDDPGWVPGFVPPA